MDFISDVARLDLKDALKLAIMQSGKTPLRVAQEMGWTLHHSNHVFGLNDYLPSARDFPRLCNVLGNTIIIDCLYGKRVLRANRRRETSTARRSWSD